MWMMSLSKCYQCADVLLMTISLQYYTFYILNCASSKAIDRFPPGKWDIHFHTVVNVCRYNIQWHFKPPTLNSCESNLKFFPRFTQCNPREYYVNRNNELLMRGTDSQSEGTLLFPYFWNPHVHLRLSYLAPATIEVYYDKNYLTT